MIRYWVRELGTSVIKNHKINHIAQRATCSN